MIVRDPTIYTNASHSITIDGVRYDFYFSKYDPYYKVEENSLIIAATGVSKTPIPIAKLLVVGEICEVIGYNKKVGKIDVQLLRLLDVNTDLGNNGMLTKRLPNLRQVEFSGGKVANFDNLITSPQLSTVDIDNCEIDLRQIGTFAHKARTRDQNNDELRAQKIRAAAQKTSTILQSQTSNLPDVDSMSMSYKRHAHSAKGDEFQVIASLFQDQPSWEIKVQDKFGPVGKPSTNITPQGFQQRLQAFCVQRQLTVSYKQGEIVIPETIAKLRKDAVEDDIDSADIPDEMEKMLASTPLITAQPTEVVKTDTATPVASLKTNIPIAEIVLKPTLDIIDTIKITKNELGTIEFEGFYYDKKLKKGLDRRSANTMVTTPVPSGNVIVIISKDETGKCSAEYRVYQGQSKRFLNIPKPETFDFADLAKNVSAALVISTEGAQSELDNSEEFAGVFVDIQKLARSETVLTSTEREAEALTAAIEAKREASLNAQLSRFWQRLTTKKEAAKPTVETPKIEPAAAPVVKRIQVAPPKPEAKIEVAKAPKQSWRALINSRLNSIRAEYNKLKANRAAEKISIAPEPAGSEMKNELDDVTPLTEAKFKEIGDYQVFEFIPDLGVSDNLFKIDFPKTELNSSPITVSITLIPEKKYHIRIRQNGKPLNIAAAADATVEFIRIQTTISFRITRSILGLTWSGKSDDISKANDARLDIISNAIKDAVPSTKPVQARTAPIAPSGSVPKPALPIVKPLEAEKMEERLIAAGTSAHAESPARKIEPLPEPVPILAAPILKQETNDFIQSNTVAVFTVELGNPQTIYSSILSKGETPKHLKTQTYYLFDSKKGPKIVTALFDRKDDSVTIRYTKDDLLIDYTKTISLSEYNKGLADHSENLVVQDILNTVGSLLLLPNIDTAYQDLGNYVSAVEKILQHASLASGKLEVSAFESIWKSEEAESTITKNKNSLVKRIYSLATGLFKSPNKDAASKEEIEVSNKSVRENNAGKILGNVLSSISKPFNSLLKMLNLSKPNLAEKNRIREAKAVQLAAAAPKHKLANFREPPYPKVKEQTNPLTSILSQVRSSKFWLRVGTVLTFVSLAGDRKVSDNNQIAAKTSITAAPFTAQASIKPPIVERKIQQLPLNTLDLKEHPVTNPPVSLAANLATHTPAIRVVQPIAATHDATPSSTVWRQNIGTKETPKPKPKTLPIKSNQINSSDFDISDQDLTTPTPKANSR